jgi:hypothetical protein
MMPSGKCRFEVSYPECAPYIIKEGIEEGEDRSF